MKLVEVNRIRNKQSVEAERTKTMILESCSFEEIQSSEYLKAALGE